jgi:chromate reductase, NAD(P)H dehydrogenase (quinone)
MPLQRQALDRVLAVTESPRAGSLNPALLRKAREEAPPGIQVEIYDIGSLPFYNADSEYNHSVSGLLTNALHWASRPHQASPLDCKPVALLGATIGRGSTVQAQVRDAKRWSTRALARWRSPRARSHARAPRSTTPCSRSV